jgi:hypothetical protein
MKALILTASTILVVMASNAQFHYGAKLGVNAATIHSKQDYNTKTSFYFGAVTQYALGKQTRIQPELYLSIQGAKWGGTDDDKTSSAYLQLPLLASYQFPKGIFIEGGPQVGFLVSASDHYDNEKHDVKEFVKKTDIGLAVGAGYEINKKLAANLRYNAGLKNWYKDESHRFFQVGINYFISKR